MLISDKELQQLGKAVLLMIDDPEYNPVEFWTISQKIIHGIIQANKKMVKFTLDWKELCEYNALIKVSANVRKFSTVKWDEARESKKQSKVDSYDKGIYEYIHLIAVRNIYNTVRDLTIAHEKNKKMRPNGSDDFDVVDIHALEDFFEVENQINVEWLEKRVGFQTERDEDE